MPVISFINNNSTVIAIGLTIISSLWALLKFREYLKDKRFETYHKLIDNLVNEQVQPGGVLKLDRQIAIVFELRNFTNYYPVTRRILSDLKVVWNGNHRIVTEIDLTLDYISQNRIVRFFRRLLGY